MTQANYHRTNPGTVCGDCIHRTRPATFCQQHSRRLQGGPVQAVLYCSGHTTERQHDDRQSAGLGAAVLLIIALLAASSLVPPAAGQTGGYPAPQTATPTWPPVTEFVCGPGCETNTPVPPYGWGATAEAEQPAATPSPMSYVEWLPLRVWLPMVARRSAR